MDSYNNGLPKNEFSMAATLYAASIPPPAAAHGGIDDLLGLIQRYDVISLDIFDTLLARRVARPTDVFELVGRMCAVPSFREVRTEAERHARARCVNCAGHGEVSLNDIYFEVERLLPRHAERLRMAELELERRLLYPNPAGVAAFQAAVAAGKQIVAISDMYLPSDFLCELLHANGFPIRQVFVSCELGASKDDKGSAFYAVARRLGVAPRQILHIGDNSRSDFEGALQAGCGAWLLVSRNDRLFRDLRFNQAAIAALMASESNLYGSFLIAWLGELLERDGSVDASRQFGRMYAAPYLFAFVSWLEQIRHRDGVRRLLLLTRDGQALQPLFALIGSDVEVQIMQSSRRMLYLATLEDNFPQTCADLARAALDRTARTFLGDLELEDGKPLLAALSRRINLDQPIRTADDIAALDAAFRHCRTELVTLARRERAALATYCAQLKVTMPDTAIVDCGWGLSTHRRLEQITGAQIRGYYIGTSDVSHAHSRIRSFLFSKNVPGPWHQLHLQSAELLELPFISRSRRAVRMRHQNGTVLPVLSTRTSGGEDLRGAIAEIIGREVASFCHSASWLQPWLDSQETSAALLTLFQALIRVPTSFEYFALATIPHARGIGEHEVKTIGAYWHRAGNAAAGPARQPSLRDYLAFTLVSLQQSGLRVTWRRALHKLRRMTRRLQPSQTSFS